GDTANYHYIDNRNRAIERLGTIVMDMIPRIYDTARQARIMEEDGKQGFVQIDPSLPVPAVRQGKKVVAINLTTGEYDVRVKSGPAFTTLLEEQNIPDGEKAAKRLAAMLPPQIQEMEKEDGDEIPPEALQQIQLKDQQIAQLSHALETAHDEHMQLEQQTKAGAAVEQMKAQNAQQIKAAELANEKAKAQIAEQVKLTIAREQMASAERIAKLNAELKLIELQANAQQAAAAREDEKILEGQRLSVDVHYFLSTPASTEKANQQKGDLER